MFFVFLLAGGLGHAAAAEKKVVVPFDFVSKFDDGHYGEVVGDQIWKKLQKEGRFVIPDSMLDVRDICNRNHLRPAPEMPMEQIGKMVQEDFAAQIGIWGSVERAPGEQWEIYDLVIKCVDFSAQPPKVIYECKNRTNSVSEIPHLYVQQMLDALCGREPGGGPSIDPDAERRWKENPNLVVGDFEQGSGGVPKGWEPLCGQQREPLGKLVRWMAEANNPGNKVVRFTLNKKVADNEGVMYYSETFPVEAGAKYRFQCRWRSNAPTVKVFIKCYDRIATDYASESPPSAQRDPGSSGSLNDGKQMREVYRSQENLKGPKNTWNTHTEDFTPQHTKYTPQWGRVMLYAYHPEGVVEFDDVVVKQIVPGITSQQNAEPRHSLATKVTVREMEENRRRSEAAKKKQKEASDP
jgi:hypothetical protein